jgi:hypothetical protein
MAADAGGHHDGVEVRERDGMWGVVATRPIAAGSELARIPRRALISVETALASLAERQMRAAALEEMTELTQLAVWLLVERGDRRSAFRPYLDALPPSFPDFPICVAPAQSALLDGTLTGSMIDYQRAMLESDHARLEIDVPWFRSFGFDDFVWAKMCVASRAFALVIGGRETKVLVPFVDMINHAPDVHTAWPRTRATSCGRASARSACCRRGSSSPSQVRQRCSTEGSSPRVMVSALTRSRRARKRNSNAKSATTPETM